MRRRARWTALGWVCWVACQTPAVRERDGTALEAQLDEVTLDFPDEGSGVLMARGHVLVPSGEVDEVEWTLGVSGRDIAAGHTRVVTSDAGTFTWSADIRFRPVPWESGSRRLHFRLYGAAATDRGERRAFDSAGEVLTLSGAPIP